MKYSEAGLRFSPEFEIENIVYWYKSLADPKDFGIKLEIDHLGNVEKIWNLDPDIGVRLYNIHIIASMLEDTVGLPNQVVTRNGIRYLTTINDAYIQRSGHVQNSFNFDNMSCGLYSEQRISLNVTRVIGELANLTGDLKSRSNKIREIMGFEYEVDDINLYALVLSSLMEFYDRSDAEMDASLNKFKFIFIKASQLAKLLTDTQRPFNEYLSGLASSVGITTFDVHRHTRDIE